MSSHHFFRSNKFRAAAVGGIGVALSLAAAACGTSTTSTAKPIGSSTTFTPPPTSAASPTPSASGSSSGAPAGTIGPDCAAFPASGNGSLKSMSTLDALQAASTNPQLSVFIAAVRAAGLDKTLNARHAFTLFIPENSAFAALSKTDLIHLRNSGDLLKIVRYHAVNAKISPAQFAHNTSFATLEGSSLKLSKSGSVFRVNGASVLCGNIQTKNATVYIISKVLLPPGV
jgi:uncharacterized surface protein with fasciclin (FAS1) repeats